jgi:hypothetical protein
MLDCYISIANIFFSLRWYRYCVKIKDESRQDTVINEREYSGKVSNKEPFVTSFHLNFTFNGIDTSVLFFFSFLFVLASFLSWYVVLL